MKNLISKAINLALEAHDHKVRKAERVPYVIHPIEVGIILAKNNLDDDVIISGIIHDAVEQEFVSLEEVGNLFGAKVKRIVEKVYIADNIHEEKPFKQRKKYTVDYLREQASPEFKFVSCADKLSNIRIIYDRYNEVGDELWNNFEQTYEEMKWYHQSLIVSLNQLYRYDMYKEYVDIVTKFFGEIPTSTFINKDLDTIDEISDYSLADNTKWLAQHNILFLAKVIEHFEMNKDKNVDKQLLDVMDEIIELNNKIKKDEEYDLSDETWINIIKLFYIMRNFFKFHDKWIKENIGVNYLSWFKLYDEKFRARLK